MKEMTLSEKVTYSTVLIKCEYSNGTFGSGTGFVFHFCPDPTNNKIVPVIVTNNHVVDNCINCTFEFCKSDENGDPIDREAISFLLRNPNCIKHSNPKVDLCCIPIAPILEDLRKNDIRIYYIPLSTSIIPNQEQLEKMSAMENATMVGYPISLFDEYNHKPILRSGITATHIKNDYQGKKEFLIDMACFPGSSGSPIFILNEGAYAVGDDLNVGSRIYLCGILYGGPQYQASGIMTFLNLPNLPTPVLNIPTNLGVAIKSSELFYFEEYFNNVLEEQHQ